MGRYNLIDEPWIKVINKSSLKEEMVGLKSLFKSSDKYLCIYGDNRVQDFVILRLCLSVLHTVFSRFNAQGFKYDEIELNDKMVQIKDVNEDDYEDYKDDLVITWSNLWKAKKFPNILFEYLDLWHDHFYLYDEDCPFYQITKDLLPDCLFNKKKRFCY